MTTIYEQTQEWLKISEAECEKLRGENAQMKTTIMGLEHERDSYKDEYEGYVEIHGRMKAEVARLTAENAMYVENIAYLSGQVLRGDEKIGKLERDKINLHYRIEELEAVLTRIDAIAPPADDTCLEPGISLSEAVRRQLQEQAND